MRTRTPPQTECAVKQCPRKGPYRKTYCEMHHDRVYRFGWDDPEVKPIRPRKDKVSGTRPCLHGGCDSTNDGAKGYCQAHYSKWLRTGTSNGAPQVKGEFQRSRKSEGYVRLEFQNGTHIYKHRYVMGKVIGRPLETNEHVHHKNGVRDDNRPENLELWIVSHPSGQRLEDKIRWALALIEQYPEEVKRIEQCDRD